MSHRKPHSGRYILLEDLDEGPAKNLESAVWFLADGRAVLPPEVEERRELEEGVFLTVFDTFPNDDTGR